MKVLRALALGFTVLVSGCDSEKSEFIGEVVDVGCRGASGVMVGGEVFDFRPVNSCGNGSGVIRYEREVTSESGNVTSEMQIACGAGFCIAQVKVNTWQEN